MSFFFLEVTEAACDFHWRGTSLGYPRDKTGAFQMRVSNIVLGKRFVRGCLKQAFWKVSSWSLAHQIRAFTSSVSAATLVSTPITADSLQGLCKASESLLWGFCQRNDKQPSGKSPASDCGRPPIKHQEFAWSCLLAEDMSSPHSSYTFPRYTSWHSSSNLTSGGVILLQPRLTIAMPVWLSFQRRAENSSSESYGPRGVIESQQGRIARDLEVTLCRSPFPDGQLRHKEINWLARNLTANSSSKWNRRYRNIQASKR